MKQSSLILIVDDNPQNLKVLGNTLTENGYNLIFAKSGVQALNTILKKKKPDLILLDVMMPEMDGFEVCRRLKQNATFSDIPVIFLTAQTDKEKVVEGFQLGAVDYVTKPFNAEELITRVHTHLKLKATEVQLKQTVEQLTQANATKDKFFSIIAHDLGNLFNGLIGLSEFLVGDYKAVDKEQFMQMIMQNSKIGQDLLKNLLEWSRLQTGRLKAQPVSLNLKFIVDSNIDLLSGQARGKNIKIFSSIEKGNVFADEHMLKTVIRNLLSNAIKFTPQNGQVEISSQEEGSEVEISIKDSGIGIEPQNLDKLFRIDVSHSTMGTANERGTGLGLVLCKEFVETNGGTIGVESEMGKGSRFYIRLCRR
jgi:signal transduction histidine kinase